MHIICVSICVWWSKVKVVCPPLVLQKGFAKMELTDLARLACQQAPRILYVNLSRGVPVCWFLFACLFFMSVLGSELGSPYLHGQHFSNGLSFEMKNL